MSGPDTSRGINFQYACAISFILNIPREPRWQTLQLEGEKDIEDILVLGRQEEVLLRVQVKQKEDPYQWEPAELIQVLQAFSRCQDQDTEETIYQFQYAGSEGKTVKRLRPILQKIGTDGYEKLTSSEKQTFQRTFSDKEVIDFLRRVGTRFKLVRSGSWEDIEARDLVRINELTFPEAKVFSQFESNYAEQLYNKLFKEIAKKTQPSSKYYRLMRRKEIIELLRKDDVLVEAWPDLGKYTIDGVKSYLEECVERLGFLPEYYPKGKFNFDQIRQQVKVSGKRLLYDRDNAFARETARRSGIFEEVDEIRQRRLEIAYQWRGSEMYETDEQITQEEGVTDWDDIRNRFDRAIILGDPGFGKSWLLRHEGRRFAQEQLLRLQKGETDEEEIDLPIYVRLGSLAENLNEKKPDVLDAILHVIQREFTFPDRFVLWMKHIIPTGRCVLLLDALDEVAGEKKQVLIDALEQFAEATACHIFLTSRIAGYRQAPFTLKGSEWNSELELVAFDWLQVTRFVNSWFGDESERAKGLLDILQSEPVLRSQARIPLLLSFICLVATRYTNIPKKRVELYETVLRLLLEGPWREFHLRELDEGRLEEKLRLLMHIAWHFASHKNRWRDLLPGSELNAVIQQAPQKKLLTQGASHNKTLLWELCEQDGLLVKAGEPPLGMARSQVPYLFLHRTIHEFLVASYLSTLDIGQLLPFIKSHLWFDPDWEVVIILLAGCLEDSQQLLETMLDESDDVFHTQLLLTGRCLAEVRDDTIEINSKLHKSITSKLLELLCSASERDRNQASIVLGQIGSSIIPQLRVLLNSKKYYVRVAVINTLGKIGSSDIVNDDLITILRDSKEHWKVRGAAARALGQIGNAKSTEAIVEATKSRHVSVATAALEALGQIGNLKVIEDLIALALNRKVRWEIQSAASDALRRIGDPAELELFAMVQDKHREDPYTIFYLLRSFHSSNLINYLMTVLQEENRNDFIRRLAITELSSTYGNRILEKLLTILNNDKESDAIKLSVVRALGNIKSKKSADILNSLLMQNSSFLIRKRIADAIRAIGEPLAVEGLVRALNDRSRAVRLEVLKYWNYASINDQRILDSLSKIVEQDEDENARILAMSLLRHRSESMTECCFTVLTRKDNTSGDIRLKVARNLVRTDADKQRLIKKFLVVLRDQTEYPYVHREMIELIIEIADISIVEDLLKILVSRHEDVRFRRYAADILEKLMQKCDPIRYCELIFQHWDQSKQIRESCIVIYSLLVRLGPRIRAETGGDWPTWRHRLMPCTEYMLNLGKK